jgi:hypothetical protein
MSLWHRKTWQPPAEPQRISIDDFERPVVDGLKVAATSMQPNSDTLQDIFDADLGDWLTASFMRTLEDILQWPERAL